jgi:hypothetical protein
MLLCSNDTGDKIDDVRELFEQGKLPWIVLHPCCNTKCGRGWKSLLRHKGLSEEDIIWAFSASCSPPHMSKDGFLLLND